MFLTINPDCISYDFLSILVLFGMSMAHLYDLFHILMECLLMLITITWFQHGLQMF
jgi:hypothetical protein